MTITASPPQTGGQVKGYNSPLVVIFCHYVFEQQKDWGIHVQLLTCSYSTQMHCATGTSLFDVMLKHELPSAATRDTFTRPAKIWRETCLQGICLIDSYKESRWWEPQSHPYCPQLKDAATKVRQYCTTGMDIHCRDNVLVYHPQLVAFRQRFLMKGRVADAMNCFYGHQEHTMYSAFNNIR